jgi:nitrogenase molybdenum-cofactor synthesis protein NifE
MKADDILALQDEPACAHNKKSKSGCAKPQPGATQGGCCFDGARNALLPIADVAHIVHGPIGCAGSSWDNRGTRSSGADVYRIGMTTDLSDLDIIMGRGEKRLFQAIKQAIESYDPAAVFVYVTCVPALHGDDVEAVVKAASERWKVPVVPVDCAGFYGNKNLGNRVAGDALYRHVIGTREPDPLPAATLSCLGMAPHDINLIGEWNVGGEFWNVAPLFDELGLRILCTLSGDSRFREVQTMHRAEANMVVCSKAMLSVARRLQEDHGTPFFEGSFYGVADTSRAFRDFARLLDDPQLSDRTEALIAREEAAVAAALAPLRRRLQGKRVLVFSGGYKSWSIVSAMQDLGMTVVATGTEKSTEEDRARIKDLMGENARMIEDNDQVALLRTFDECQADILIAGDRYIYPTLKSRIPFLDIDHVRSIGYAGYSGLVELARQLVRSVESPVWGSVRKAAPWEALRAAAPVSVAASAWGG